jgi:hypothetical protein
VRLVWWFAAVASLNGSPAAAGQPDGSGTDQRVSRRHLELGLTLKPNTHVALSVRTERNDVTLPEGTFYTQSVMVRADYNFTPNVSWANFAQYDNESRIAGLQSRWRVVLFSAARGQDPPGRLVAYRRSRCPDRRSCR